MKIKLIIISVIIIVIALVGFYFYSKSAKELSHENHTETIYTCSMHPQISKNKPGNCPICGMQLIEKNILSKEDNVGDLGTILFPTNEFAIGNYETIQPIDTTMSETIEIPGILTYNTNTSIGISTRISGRIERSYIKFNYQQIREGDKLFDIYSPELLVAQNNFLYLLNSNQIDSSIVESSRKNLEYLGLSKVQIENLELKREARSVITIYSPKSGVVVVENNRKNSNEAMQSQIRNADEVGLKSGSYILKNTTLLTLISTENIWGVFYAKRDMVSLLKINTNILITTEANKSIRIHGKIGFIENQIVGDKKNIGFRVNIKNDFQIPIGTILIGKLTLANIKGIWVPKSAVITIGNKQIVLIKMSNGFKTKEVSIGKERNGYLQIIEGINQNTILAKNAQYLMDSESFIK
jgi:Cu(I)/Ag(I) efflux system membrane fusion protein